MLSSSFSASKHHQYHVLFCLRRLLHRKVYNKDVLPWFCVLGIKIVSLPSCLKWNYFLKTFSACLKPQVFFCFLAGISCYNKYFRKNSLPHGMIFTRKHWGVFWRNFTYLFIFLRERWANKWGSRKSKTFDQVSGTIYRR